MKRTIGCFLRNVGRTCIAKIFGSACGRSLALFVCVLFFLFLLLSLFFLVLLIVLIRHFIKASYSLPFDL